MSRTVIIIVVVSISAAEKIHENYTRRSNKTVGLAFMLEGES